MFENMKPAEKSKNHFSIIWTSQNLYWFSKLGDYLTTINIFAHAPLNFFFTLSNCSSSKSVTGSVMFYACGSWNAQRLFDVFLILRKLLNMFRLCLGDLFSLNQVSILLFGIIDLLTTKEERSGGTVLTPKTPDHQLGWAVLACLPAGWWIP